MYNFASGGNRKSTDKEGRFMELEAPNVPETCLCPI